jgi:hypothetical protein
MWKPTRR